MKKLIILMLILAAGLTAYPQSSRSSREAKSSKSKSSQVASRSSSRSGSSKAVKSSSNKSRSQATKARSSASRSAINKSSSSRSSAPKTVNRSSSSRSSAPKTVNRSSGSRSSSAVRSSRSQSASGNAVKSSGSSSRTSRSAINSSSSNNRQNASRSSTASRSSRNDVKKGNNTLQSTNSRATVPSKVRNSERGRADSNTAVKSRTSAGRDQASRASSSSSFDRSNRQGNKTYVRNDGAKFRHQNDEVFTRARYKVDYRDVRDIRRSNDFIRIHNHYHNWYSHRHVRRVVVHNHFYRPLSLEIRRYRYPYRRPVHIDLCWTPHLHHSFVYYYPLHTSWNNIHYGDYIETASSYEAMNYVGTVKRVYGKVEEVYYSPEDKTYTLYYGAPYPYHDFSVVVPRGVAKSFSWSPSWYFEDEHVWVVGLIEMWEGKPEIVVHDEQQLRRY